MVRKLSWLVALLALNCSMGAFALGLGDIDLHSALNQPLNADIELLSVRPIDADSIKVLLGSAGDFEHAGVERPYLLNELRFLVVAKGKGHYRIHVSSAQAIREPFLDFLVQVTWRGGQLLREYTVLLDPPVLMPAPVQVITAPVTKGATLPPPVAVAAPAPAPAPAAPVITPGSAPLPPQTDVLPAAASLSGNTYGPVHPRETLWSIANRARPDSKVSVARMMQAILKANPDAFINNNINNLKSGEILRIPTAIEVASISAEQAHAATLKQNELWRNKRKEPIATPPVQASEAVKTTPPVQAPEVVKTAPKAAPEAEQKPAPATPTAQKPTQTEAQLKVVAADASKPGGTPAEVKAPPSTAGADVHKELALANEAAETQRQETEDLRVRLTDLEQQISTMQKLMKIKDEQIGSLQVKSAPPVAVQQAGDPLRNPATLAMIGIIAVLLAALVWVALRKRQLVAPSMPREVRAEPLSPATAPAPSPVSTARAVTATVAAGAVTAAAVRAATESSGPAPQQPVNPVAEPHPESDPLSEADIYLAYGRYQQAEDLIKESMRHDRNPELSLKLLEIYYAAKNATGFEDAARDLRHDVGANHELWQRALLMGRELCPYSLLFANDQNDAPAAADTDHPVAATSAPDSYDFDLGGSEDTVLAPSRIAQEPVNHSAATSGEPDDALDEVGTKLDLARAYIDMGDPEGARSILDEVLQEGSATQKDEAHELLRQVTR